MHTPHAPTTHPTLPTSHNHPPINPCFAALLPEGVEPTTENILARGWPASVHIIGKDILRFHAVYWPAMLMAAGGAGRAGKGRRRCHMLVYGVWMGIGRGWEGWGRMFEWEVPRSSGGRLIRTGNFW